MNELLNERARSTRRRWISCGHLLLISLLLVSCGTSPVASIAELKAAEEGLTKLQETINMANGAMRDRLGQTSAQVDKTLKDVRELLAENGKKAIDAYDLRIARLMRQANETLYQASESALSLEAALSEDVNNSLLTTANIVSGIPFVKVRPFISMTVPTVFIPGASQDYQFRIAGFFHHDWSEPEIALQEGSNLKAGLRRRTTAS